MTVVESTGKHMSTMEELTFKDHYYMIEGS
jgi:hypothetical protein